MVTFKTKVYKVEEEDVIGAEVTIYSEAGEKIKEIYITSAEALNDLENRVKDLERRPVSTQELINALSTIDVDAATLNGKSDSDFAAYNHTHNDYAPKNHKSASTDYGVATASEYGHVKIADNLTTNTFNSASPVALSAKQGQVLSNSLASKVSKSEIVDNLNTVSSNNPLSAKQGQVLKTTIEEVRTIALKALDIYGPAQILLDPDEWVDSYCFVVVRAGMVTITFNATTTVDLEELTPFNLTRYLPLMDVKNAILINIPEQGDIPATIDINTNGACTISSEQELYPAGTKVQGMIVYPYEGY